MCHCARLSTEYVNVDDLGCVFCSPGSLIRETADELPWLCRHVGDKSLLESTLCDPRIVTCLYLR